MSKANAIPALSATTAAKFWSKVDQDGECWEWIGKRSTNGYGRFTIAPRRMTAAHRVAYTLTTGDIPEGLVVDHLCRNRACVNPSHLEAVSQQVNVLRGEAPTAKNAAQTHCHKGHPFDVANTTRTATGRVCRECHRAYHRKYQEQLRATPGYERRAYAENRRPATDFEHGTYRGYNQAGCRCVGCKAANAAYTRDYRAKKKAA